MLGIKSDKKRSLGTGSELWAYDTFSRSLRLAKPWLPLTHCVTLDRATVVLSLKVGTLLN